MSSTLSTQISFIAAVVNLAMAAVVLGNNPRHSLNQSYSLMAFCLFGWNLFTGLNGVVEAEWTVVVSRLFLTFIPVTSYHFVLSFVSRYRRDGWWLLKVSYVVAAVVDVLIYAVPGLRNYWYLLFCYLAFPPMFMMGLHRLRQRLQRTVSSLEREQIAYILFGSIVALALSATNVLQHLGLYQYSLANLGTFLFSLLIAVVIVRFGFLDVGIVVGRGLLILTLATFISLFYRISGLWFRETTFALFFNVLLATVFLIIIFEPLRSLMENIADRVLQRESHVFQERITRLSKDIVSIVDQDELFRHTFNTLRESHRVQHAALFIQDAQEKGYRQVQPAPTDPRRAYIDADKPLAQFLHTQKRILIKEEIQRDLNQTWSSLERRKRLVALQRGLNWQGMDVCVPFLFHNNLRGMLFLTLQRHQPMLNRRERDLLLALGGQLAISLENTRIYRRMSENDRLAALGEMAAGLAHEIRNPLGAIKGSAQILHTDELNQQQREFLDIIIQEVDRLNQVLTRFLVFARPETKHIEPHSMAVLIEKVIPLLKNSPGGEQVTIEVDSQADLPEVLVDGDELRQVLLNLLLNARDAMPRGGRILVQLSLDPGGGMGRPSRGVVVAIRDDGVGISPENLRKIFTPFFTTREQGTGLGLAMSRRIVQDLGGSIEVESTVDVGTTFRLYLPAVPTEEPPSPAKGS